ncbi:MAG: hypothetical protein K6T85_01535 [Gorillibacterium sp.]|nr:hypothetical protein [Gorillibacterium sp.]
MIKLVYRKAFDEITADQALLVQTTEKMGKAHRAKKHPAFRQYAVICAFVGVLLILALVRMESLQVQTPATARPSAGETATSPADMSGNILAALLPNVASHYVPFQATSYGGSKAPAPFFPFSYQELQESSVAVLLVTVEDIGVYRKNEEAYQPKASFGTYLYTVKVDRVLQGQADTDNGDHLAIAERAWADPVQAGQVENIVDWQFSPYTFRAEATRTLATGKQYVVFLQAKDETGCYPPASNGFGIFPIDYIDQEAARSVLPELEEQYKLMVKTTRAPMEHDLLFRLSSLYVKRDFL